VSRSSRKPNAGNAERRAHRTFSAAFKVEAVHLMRRRRAQGVTLAQIGRELDVRPQLLWEWARRQDGRGTGRVDGPPGIGRAAPDEESLEDEVRRLRREVAVLRQEREFAKKAAAFFAKESL
jgi:transposase